MTEFQLEITEKTRHTYKFQIVLEDTTYHVYLDKNGVVWVDSRKIESSWAFKNFNLGNHKAEIYATYWGFGLGIQSIWLQINNQTAYFETIPHNKAKYIEAIVSGIMLLLLGIVPSIVMSSVIITEIITMILHFFHLDISKNTHQDILLGIGVILGVYILYSTIWGGVSKSLLVEKKDIVQIETEHNYKGLPFGYKSYEWEEFKLKIQDNDEIWLWRTSALSWKMLVGREGLVIVRNGKPTHHTFLTGMN